MLQLCVWEARVLMPLSCSPNFPCDQYLDIRTQKHELIVNFCFLYNVNQSTAQATYWRKHAFITR